MGNHEIKNIEVYNNNMQKSIFDKMYFIDKIGNEVNTIIDFGCANGVVLKEINRLYPNYNLFGYDINEEMINQATINVPNALFTNNWNTITSNIKLDNSMLNLSSVIHEVYSYGNSESVKKFWEDVYNTGFKYICIRDMMLSNTTMRPTEINKKIKVLNKTNKETLNDFINHWGNIDTTNNFIHYLLKYRYVDNWERELNENYLPIFLEDFIKLIPIDKYEVVYYNHYTLPYLQETIKKDFKISIEDNTHLQMILKLRD